MPQDPLEIEVKRLDSLEIKGGDEEGHVEAVIATLDVVDRDHDIILPGAIKDGAHVTLSDYGHSTVIAGTLPVGKGTVQTKDNKVYFRGRYFMSTDRGKEAFRTIKEMGLEHQEWSFGFTVDGHEIPDAELQKKGAWRILTKLGSFEVSPVIRGAGIGTRTVSVKAAGANPPPEPTLKELPTPNTDESREDFVSRCMGSDAMQSEFPEQDQRAAVCNRQWEESRAKGDEGKAAEVPEVKEDPAEAERKQAELDRKLQEEIDVEVERFQRTQRLFSL